MTQRRGVHLIEALVVLCLLAAIAGPFVGWALTNRRGQVRSEKHAVARALLSFLAQDCLQRRPGSLTPLVMTPATSVRCLAAWAAQVATREELEKAWAGISIGREVAKDGRIFRVRLVASWPEGRHAGSLELSLEVDS